MILETVLAVVLTVLGYIILATGKLFRSTLVQFCYTEIKDICDFNTNYRRWKTPSISGLPSTGFRFSSTWDQMLLLGVLEDFQLLDFIQTAICGETGGEI
jgi:hypothetical protein